MRVSKLNSLFIGLLISLPWFWASYGGWKSGVSFDLVVSFLTISVFLVLVFYYSCRNISKRISVTYYSRYWYFFVLIVNVVILFGRLRLSYDNNFQLGLVRHLYFTDLGLQYVYFGSSLVSSIYSKIVVPFTIVLLILPCRHKLVYSLLLFVMLVSFSLIGGRFFIYYISIIILLRQLLDNKIFTKQLLFIVGLIIFSFFIISIRLNRNVIDSLTYIFQQVENYHVIQLVVISDYNDFPVSLSPYFLGFDSFISYIIGDTPTETLLAGYLQNVEIYAYNGDGPFNAFGTSLSYFYPLFGVLIGTSVFLLLFLVLYLSMFRFFKNKREPIIILFGFLVYFSAFAPLLFSFSSYSFMAIFIFSCFRLRKGKRHNYVFLSR